MKNSIVNIELLPDIERLSRESKEAIITFRDGRRYHANILFKEEYYPNQDQGDFQELVFSFEANLTFEELPEQEKICNS